MTNNRQVSYCFTMFYFMQRYLIGFIRFSKIWSDKADREKEVHTLRKAIAQTGVFCYIILFYKYIHLFIYILDSDFVMKSRPWEGNEFKLK